MEKKHSEGVKKGEILLYALSTCVWCQKTKKLLKEMGVDFYYIDVDLLEDEDKKKVEEEMKRWNPRGSFPTLIINNQKCIVGFQEDEIRKALIE
ncbi:MAG: glutaredoxin family protein [candidate division WOR-3 bacterium]